MKKENHHLNKISLSDGTVFYCNDKFLKEFKKEILNYIREQNLN